MYSVHPKSICQWWLYVFYHSLNFFKLVHYHMCSQTDKNWIKNGLLQLFRNCQKGIWQKGKRCAWLNDLPKLIQLYNFEHCVPDKQHQRLGHPILLWRLNPGASWAAASWDWTQVIMGSWWRHWPLEHLDLWIYHYLYSDHALLGKTNRQVQIHFLDS